MTKRTIVETIKEYDENGNLVRETVTEAKEDDDTVYFSYPVQTSQITPGFPDPWWGICPPNRTGNGGLIRYGDITCRL